MTQTPLTQLTTIHGLILEDHPYILPFEILKHAADGRLVVKLPNNQAYYQSRFSELIQVISTIGSYCLALQMNDMNKRAFLAERLRIKKLSFHQSDERDLTLTVIPVPHTPRKAKAIMVITAGTDLLYSYDIDYTIFTEHAFHKVFQQFYRESNYETADHQSSLPPVVVESSGELSFRIGIGPYQANHCMGHFSDHPIVPAVFATNNLIEGIRKWFALNDMDSTSTTLDGVESYLYKAMPIDTKFKAEVVVKNLSSKVMMFSASIQDHQNTEYGIYILTFEKSK